MRAARQKIHVDIDPSEINKNVVADAAIVGDLRETLADFLDVLEPEDHAPWLAYIDSMKGDAAVRDIQKLPDTGHLCAAHVINDIWRITGGNAVVVTDVGQHQMWEAQYTITKRHAFSDHVRRPRCDGVCDCPRRSGRRSPVPTRRCGRLSVMAASR